MKPEGNPGFVWIFSTKVSEFASILRGDTQDLCSNKNHIFSQRIPGFHCDSLNRIRVVKCFGDHRKTDEHLKNFVESPDFVKWSSDSGAVEDISLLGTDSNFYMCVSRKGGGIFCSGARFPVKKVVRKASAEQILLGEGYYCRLNTDEYSCRSVFKPEKEAMEFVNGNHDLFIDILSMDIAYNSLHCKLSQID